MVFWLNWFENRERLTPGCFELGASWCCAPARHAQVFHNFFNLLRRPRESELVEKDCSFRCGRIFKKPKPDRRNKFQIAIFGNYWISLQTVPQPAQEISEFKQVYPHLTQSNETYIKVFGAEMIKPWTELVYGCMDRTHQATWCKSTKSIF